MHILALLAAVIGGIVFWYYRIRVVKDAARDLVDTVETVQGAWRRHKFRSKATRPPLDDVDDVRVAAVAVMVSIAECAGPMTADQEAAISQLVESKFGMSDGTELVAYARWLVKDSPDPNNVSMRLASLFNDKLDKSEKDELIAMVRSTAPRLGNIDPIQTEAIERLRGRLGR